MALVGSVGGTLVGPKSADRGEKGAAAVGDGDGDGKGEGPESFSSIWELLIRSTNSTLRRGELFVQFWAQMPVGMAHKMEATRTRAGRKILIGR